ncbi:hypothetical protein J437_LFUL008084 [Ladona fulva]|uniref:Uncharacterized protein n=1 Tax=Ladona fulva TaxID=123851 RepID=A0A8K0KAR7_LADFU|nr:hypothetical protein J437_LFUL008084 [Ladona fulva]
MVTRASPVSKAQTCRPMAVRNGIGLPDHGQFRLKKRVYQKEEVCTFRTGSLNVGTMTGKSREISDLRSRRRLKILCVQETRLKGNKAKELAEGYTTAERKTEGMVSGLSWIRN